MPALPHFALFVLQNHPEDFTHKGIETLSITNPDSFKMLRIEKERIFDYARETSRDFLIALSEGKELERIEKKASRIGIETHEINKEFINLKNITSAYSAQQKSLTSFLFKYTKEEELILTLIEEINGYYITAISIAYDRILSVMHENIKRQNDELEWLNSNLEKNIIHKTSALEEANRLLSHITDNVPGLIALISKDLKYVFANKTYEDWFGVKRNEIIGRHIEEVVGKEAFEKVLPFIKKALAGEEFQKEIEMPYIKGGTRMADIRIKPTFKENEIDGYLVLLTDVTENRQTSKALIKSEKKLRTLAESIPMKVWSLDNNGNLEYVNQAWTEYSGLSLEETQEDSFSTIHSEDVPNLLEAWKNGSASNEPYEVEARIRRRRDGKYRWHLMRNSPLKDSGNNVIQWFGSSLDIHEQKINEQRKDDFIGIAGHELKTPLTSLKAYAELLLDEELGLVQRKYMETINNQVKRLEKLVSDLLDVTKINSGSLNMFQEEIDWNEIVDIAIDTIQSTAPAYKFKKSSVPDVKVFGDRDRLLQVMVNLLSNAVKYSPDGSEVAVNFKSGGKLIETTIIDKGVGIKDTELDNVFTKFYRAQNPMSKTQGLGIGLYIAKQIVSLHKGEIQVKSEYGAGSEFSVVLPVL